ncbi:hypothetical protein PS862_05813 [Pseudomonas fluorescens]|uniref:Heme utilization protein n=1 Tax=Pseudomonas fluorescens TaxID=294 RepID=A0A5E7QDS6_PSEFL|nr:heme utilization protein [Pseudomonas fluorescens]VVM79578.1 hypothetical protein PS639_02202 [Pseudomonas fluorescens]VVP57093.1 hypothetical protein PS862_05813 [Pseudomonas fluorescens]
MKPTMALKPLVFALAAVMAIAAQAGGRDDDRGHGHGNGHGNNNGHDRGPSFETLLSLKSGAKAAVLDVQNSYGNKAFNQGTKNEAKGDNSLNGSNGNAGANIAAGDGNQQDNAAALATADESFIFGTATAVSAATQYNTRNGAKNYSSSNASTLNNAGSNGSGNIGMNVTSGSFNQQKNNLAIAVSGGRVATAAAVATQSSTGLDVDNYGTQVYKTDTLTGTFTAAGAFVAAGKAVSREDDHHGNGHGYGKDKGGRGGHDDVTKSDFVAVGVFGLAGVTTEQKLTPDGWKNPVTNTATMAGSMNGFSGNGGANVSSGVGNQQSNSLSIAAGCNACL